MKRISSFSVSIYGAYNWSCVCVVFVPNACLLGSSNIEAAPYATGELDLMLCKILFDCSDSGESVCTQAHQI